MSELSIMLSQTFISHFKYCDASRQRGDAWGWGWVRLFQTSELTTELESLANQAAKEMAGILESCKRDNQERADTIYFTLLNIIEDVWKLRVKYGVCSYVDGFTAVGECCPASIKITTPMLQSRFEEELDNVLENMKLSTMKVDTGMARGVYVDLQCAQTRLRDNAKRGLRVDQRINHGI